MWSPPGDVAPSHNWRYDLKKGWTPPGQKTDRRGLQLGMGDDFDPDYRNVGWHVLSSPPGTQAPLDAINYTPDTREVHAFGMAAPKDKLNLSVLPETPGPAQLGQVGMGQDQSPWQQNQNQLGSLGITSDNPWSTQTVGGGSVGLGQDDDIPMSYPEAGEQPGWLSTPGARPVTSSPPQVAAPSAPQPVAADPNDIDVIFTSGPNNGGRGKKSVAVANGWMYDIAPPQGTTTTPTRGIRWVKDNVDPSQAMAIDDLGLILVDPTGERRRRAPGESSTPSGPPISAAPNTPYRQRRTADGSYVTEPNPDYVPPGSSKDEVTYREVPGKGLTAFDPKTNTQVRPGAGLPGGSPSQNPRGPSAAPGSPQAAFLQKFGPYAKQVEAETGIDAGIMLAIAANETGWGDQVAGQNFFGIKGSNPRTGANTGEVPTWEVVDGKPVQTTATFRAYDNPADSFRDFAYFIANNERYANALQYIGKNGDPAKFVQAIHAAGYATDPDWTRKVLSIAGNLATGGVQASGGQPGDGGLYVGSPGSTGTWTPRTLPSGKMVLVNSLTGEQKDMPGGEAATKARPPVVVKNRLMEWDPAQGKYVETLKVQPDLQHFSTNEGIFSFNPETSDVRLVRPKGGVEFGATGPVVYPGAGLDIQDYDPQTKQFSTRSINNPAPPAPGGSPTGQKPQTVPDGVTQPTRPSTMPPPMDAAGSPVASQNQVQQQIADEQAPVIQAPKTGLDDDTFGIDDELGKGQAAGDSGADDFFMIPVLDDFAGDVGVGQGPEDENEIPLGAKPYDFRDALEYGEPATTRPGYGTYSPNGGSTPYPTLWEGGSVGGEDPPTDVAFPRSSKGLPRDSGNALRLPHTNEDAMYPIEHPKDAWQHEGYHSGGDYWEDYANNRFPSANFSAPESGGGMTGTPMPSDRGGGMTSQPVIPTQGGVYIFVPQPGMQQQTSTPSPGWEPRMNSTPMPEQGGGIAANRLGDTYKSTEPYDNVWDHNWNEAGDEPGYSTRPPMGGYTSPGQDHTDLFGPGEPYYHQPEDPRSLRRMTKWDVTAPGKIGEGQGEPQTVGADPMAGMMQMLGGAGGGSDPSMQQGGGWQPPLDPSQVVGGGNKFGDQVSMEGTHEGTDLQAYKGTPVTSPVDGTVVDIKYDAKGLGLQVVVRGSDGVNHTVAHLDQAHVKIGQPVKMGEPLGQVGESGDGATGPHLDYRMQGPSGQPINPEPMLGALGQLPPAPGTIGEAGTPQTGSGQGWNPQGSLGQGQDEEENPGFEVDPNASGGAWGVPSDIGQTPPGNYGNNTPGGINLNNTVIPSQGSTASSGGAGSQSSYPPSQGGTGNPIKPLDNVQLANLQLAQQKINQDNQRIQNDLDKENNRHNEALATAKSQQEVNAENNRHNQEMEQIQRDQNSISQEANRLGLIERGTFQQQTQAGLTKTALTNPWIQNLTGMAPGFGQPGWSSQTGGGTLQNLLNGWTPQGTLNAAGINDSGVADFASGLSGGGAAGWAGNAPLQGMPPMPSYDQWQQMDPFEQSAWRAMTELVQPWAATQNQLQQFWASSPSASQQATSGLALQAPGANASAGSVGSMMQAPGVTSMPGVTRQQAMNMNPRDLQATQNTAEVFGMTPDELWKNSERQWSQSAQPNVSQSFHVPNQGGVGTGQGRGWVPRVGHGEDASADDPTFSRFYDSRRGGRGPAPGDVARDDWRLTDSFPPDYQPYRFRQENPRPAGRDDWSGHPANFIPDYTPYDAIDPHPDETQYPRYESIRNPYARQ